MARRMLRLGLAILPILVAGGCSADAHEGAAPSVVPAQASGGTERAPALRPGQAEAVFAGGCFWCVEAAFEPLPGVEAVVSGYTGGDVEAPTYEAVSSGRTGHLEAVRIVYDPSRISYRALLDVFFRNIDATQSDGQFCDRGEQYRTAIFVRTDEERRLATDALDRARARLGGRAVATSIRDAGPFWVAESYHQDFYRTNPERYASYRRACGRDARLEELGAGAANH